MEEPTAVSDPKSNDGLRAKLWWITLIRGITALLLGIALLLAPVKGKSMMARYMGMYWIASGAMSISWGRRAARRPGLWLVAGLVGVIGGVVVVAHSLLAPLRGRTIIVELFAVAAILTGLLHVLGGYRIRQEYGRRWSGGGFFLGLVQIILGVLLLASPEEVPRGIMLAAMIWALIGGIGLLADALRVRRLAVARREKNTCT
jgi:uncharacterized membrane protein HdeD (DUF308 family)